MSQINITHNEQQFNYQVEYIKDNALSGAGFTYSYKDDPMIIQLENRDYQNAFYEHSQWSLTDSHVPVYVYLPEYTTTCTLRLYMPQYSVDTYTATDYIFETYTYINGKKVIIGSFLFNRSDCLANPYNIRIKNKEYMEYIDFTMPDPWEMMYGDNWIEFREKVCEEPELINNAGSVITCALYPVYSSNNLYSVLKEYNGGSCGINIGLHESDYLNLVLNVNDDVEVNAIYNEEYKDDFWLYLFETYNIRASHADFLLFINTKDGPINVLQKSIYSEDTENGPIGRCVSWSFEELGFNTWNQWSEDLKLECVMTIYTTIDNQDVELMSVKSNMIPITQNVFRFLLPMNGFKGINLVEITDMNNYKLNVVNKIDKKVVKIEHPSDAKANILKPIFIQANTLNDTIFHPEVTENICISLNQYKSSVDIFYLKIEGIEFTEIGRVPAGVVFNINGSKLPNKTKEGLYYILNEEHELVTTGKYIYKQ